MNQRILIQERMKILRNNVPESTVARFLQAREEGKNFLIFDLEINAHEEDIHTVPGVDRIIQIGACLTGPDLGIIELWSVVVNPYPDRLSPYITKLTSITQRRADRGCYFPEAYETFMTMFDPNNTILCSYGAFDLRHLAAEIELFELNSPTSDNRWLKEALNVKSAAASLLKLDGRRSLESVMDLLDIDPIGHSHDADIDAIHTLTVLQELFRDVDNS